MDSLARDAPINEPITEQRVSKIIVLHRSLEIALHSQTDMNASSQDFENDFSHNFRIKLNTLHMLFLPKRLLPFRRKDPKPLKKTPP
jgi:hypothetical protein